jgi:hypothetical protein
MRSTLLESIFTLTALTFMAAGCGSASSGGIKAAPATTSGDFTQPRDAVPNSDGTTFYFTARTSGGAPGVFQVPAGGGQATLVTSGAPLVSPNSLAISTDDKTLYVTDGGGSGQIFAVPISGGPPSALSGTSGTAPVGIEVGRSGSDLLYFTGKSASGGQPGVFTISPTGGTPNVVLAGSPLTSPGGVTVANNGDVYVVNIEGSAQNGGCIYKVVSSTSTLLTCGLIFGNPSGITLNLAQDTLLASGMDLKGHDLVYTIDLATRRISTADDDISQNTAGGGVHRAKNADIFSWADLTAGTAGTVYKITFR